MGWCSWRIKVCGGDDEGSEGGDGIRVLTGRCSFGASQTVEPSIEES